MKYQVIFSIFAVCISLTFFGCKKNKDEKPVAEFTATPIANGGVEVTFTGKGSPSWEFGGTGVTVGYGNTVQFYYETIGNYQIKLTASKNSGETATSTQLVKISGVPTQVKITAVKLNNFTDLNAVGDPWDSDATGPDVKFVYYSGFTGYNDLTSIYPNLTHAVLPLSVTLTTPKVIPTTTASFSVFCYDDNYIGQYAIEVVNVNMYNITAQSNCANNCSEKIYPTTYTSSSYDNQKNRIVLSLEWLP